MDSKIKLQSSDESGQEFGRFVAISGNYVIIGAAKGNVYTGAAYIFEKGSDDNWGVAIASGSDRNETQKLLAKTVGSGDWFGFSVAISGNYAIVGAFMNDDRTTDAGAAYIFERNSSGNWGIEVSDQTYRTETIKLLASDGNASDNFGYSVAISGNYAIVGAYNDDDDDRGNNSGSVYIFERDINGNWGETKKLFGV